MGGMTGVGTPELAAKMTEAGGLGVFAIHNAGGETDEEMIENGDSRDTVVRATLVLSSSLQFFRHPGRSTFCDLGCRGPRSLDLDEARHDAFSACTLLDHDASQMAPPSGSMEGSSQLFLVNLLLLFF